MWKTLEWPHYFIERRGWFNKTSLTLSLFIEMPVLSQQSQWAIMYIRVRTIDLASVSTTMRFDFFDSVIFMVFHFSISADSLNTFAHASSYFIIHPVWPCVLHKFFLAILFFTKSSHAVKIKSIVKQVLLSIPYSESNGTWLRKIFKLWKSV